MRFVQDMPVTACEIQRVSTALGHCQYLKNDLVQRDLNVKKPH